MALAIPAAAAHGRPRRARRWFCGCRAASAAVSSPFRCANPRAASEGTKLAPRELFCRRIFGGVRLLDALAEMDACAHYRTGERNDRERCGLSHPSDRYRAYGRLSPFQQYGGEPPAFRRVATRSADPPRGRLFTGDPA